MTERITATEARKMVDDSINVDKHLERIYGQIRTLVKRKYTQLALSEFIDSCNMMLTPAELDLIVKDLKHNGYTVTSSISTRKFRTVSMVYMVYW